MRVGLQVPYFKYPGGDAAIPGTLADIARTADEAGFYSLWVMDHFFQLQGMLGPAEDPMLEGYTTLGYLAGVAQKVKLGTLVTGVIYRYPALLIKTVNTLDVVSNGRAYFGVGAAWYEREATALGVPFPEVKVRFEWLEETLRIANQMWSVDNGAFEGEHFQLAETLNSPQPISQPHPPIMIGGMGERKTLRLVAQYADACNLFAAVGVGELARKLDVLRAHCADLGRSYDDIEKTSLGTVHVAREEMSASDVIETCRQLADVGIEHAIFNMPNAHDITPLKVFGDDIIPAVSNF